MSHTDDTDEFYPCHPRVICVSVSHFKMQTQTLKLSKTKEIIFTTAFVGLAVYVPYLIHYFGGINIGRTFLPMYFFVLVAGLLLGWRAGLVTGILTPLISYLITGMPMANMLPFIVVELSAYGFLAGLLKERLNIWISLILAIIIGRLLAGLAVFFFSDNNALNFMLSAVKDGWRGIILQIVFIPIIVKKLYQYFRNDEL